MRTVAASGNELVMDYFDSGVFLPENQSPAIRALFNRAQRFGEPFISGFDPSTLAEELAALGIELLEDLDHEGQGTRYFAGRDDGLRPVKLVHFVHAAYSGSGISQDRQGGPPLGAVEVPGPRPAMFPKSGVLTGCYSARRCCRQTQSPKPESP
jgi:hypothetical protein